MARPRKGGGDYLADRLRPLKPWYYELYRHVAETPGACVKTAEPVIHELFPHWNTVNLRDYIRKAFRSLRDAGFLILDETRQVGMGYVYQARLDKDEECRHACESRAIPIPTAWKDGGDYIEGKYTMEDGTEVILQRDGTLLDPQSGAIARGADKHSDAFRETLIQRQRTALNAILAGIAETGDGDCLDDRLTSGLMKMTTNMVKYAQEERSSGAVRAFEAVMRIARLAGEEVSADKPGMTLSTSEDALANLALLIGAIRDMRTRSNL